MPMSLRAGTEVVDPVILPPLCTRGVILCVHGSALSWEQRAEPR